MLKMVRICLALSLVPVCWPKTDEPRKCCRHSWSKETRIYLEEPGSDVINTVDMYFDFAHGRQTNLHFRINNTKELIYKSVMDFQTKMSYHFPCIGLSSQCFSQPLTVLSPLQCVSGFASYIDLHLPGRQLNQEVAVWQVDQPHIGVYLTYGFSRNNCAPVFVRQYGTINDVHVEEDHIVIDYSELIGDMSIFDIPKECSFLADISTPSACASGSELQNASSDYKLNIINHLEKITLLENANSTQEKLLWLDYLTNTTKLSRKKCEPRQERFMSPIAYIPASSTTNYKYISCVSSDVYLECPRLFLENTLSTVTCYVNATRLAQAGCVNRNFLDYLIFTQNSNRACVVKDFILHCKSEVNAGETCGCTGHLREHYVFKFMMTMEVGTYEGSSFGCRIHDCLDTITKASLLTHSQASNCEHIHIGERKSGATSWSSTKSGVFCVVFTIATLACTWL